MSQSRQSIDPPSDTPVTGISSVHDSGLLPAHVHSDQAQLMYAVRGMMNVTTPMGRWILPAGRALWIAAGTEHGLEVRTSVSLDILYLRASMRALPSWPECAVVNVSALLRALISACVSLPARYALDSAEGRLAAVLVDQLAAMAQAPVDLPEPRDPRAVRIAQLARDNPADRRPLAVLAPIVASSPRTIERLFASETGMSFGAWRHRHRLIVALERLAEGENVATAGDSVGYDNPSSFIAAFRAMFGKTPGRYFQLD